MLISNNLEELQYLHIMNEILEHWVLTNDRTGVWTHAIFGTQMKFNLSNWFPLLTSKKVFFRWIFVELIWFFRWDTNIKYLVDRDVHIWDEWAYDNYKKNNQESLLTQEEFINQIKNLNSDDIFVKTWWELWPVYWKQWRDFNGSWIDQIQKLIYDLTNKPSSRRHIVCAWNPQQIDNMLLPSCHTLWQCNVSNNKLNLWLLQRSWDWFLWIPFNIASYSLIIILLSKILWLEPWTFVHTIHDAHLYTNHVDQAKLQLSRKNELYQFPILIIKKNISSLEDICNLEFEDIELKDYKCHWSIKASVAV